jgi:hypothetical protein
VLPCLFLALAPGSLFPPAPPLGHTLCHPLRRAQREEHEVWTAELGSPLAVVITLVSVAQEMARIKITDEASAQGRTVTAILLF